MKTFVVKYKAVVRGTVTVLADDEEKALSRAKNLHSHEFVDWDNIESIECKETSDAEWSTG